MIFILVGGVVYVPKVNALDFIVISQFSLVSVSMQTTSPTLAHLRTLTWSALSRVVIFIGHYSSDDRLPQRVRAGGRLDWIEMLQDFHLFSGYFLPLLTVEMNYFARALELLLELFQLEFVNLFQDYEV